MPKHMTTYSAALNLAQKSIDNGDFSNLKNPGVRAALDRAASSKSGYLSPQSRPYREVMLMATALQIKFPIPDRSDQVVTGEKDEDGILDIGWCEGVMSDGRPFRMESWAQDGISMITIFFSDSGISELDSEQIKSLLLREGFVSFYEGAAQHVSSNTIVDPSGNTMWSTSIVVGDEDQTYASGSLPIFAHLAAGKPTSIFNRT
jgi:hypothetical protein